MRVAYLDTTCHPYKPGASGLSDIAWEMAGAAARQGIDASLFGAYAVPTVGPQGVKLIQLPPVKLWGVSVLGHFLTSMRVWNMLKRIDAFDALHTPEYVTPGVLAPFVKWPMVCTVSGNIYDRIQNGNPFGPVTTQSFKLYTRSTAKYSSIVIAVSKAMEAWWSKCGTPKSRLKQIPAGVDIERFRRVEVDKSTLGFDANFFEVIFVGRLSHEKGIWDQLEAMRLLKGKPIRLHLFGDGPLKSKIEAYLQTHDLEQSVCLRGSVPRADLPRYYSAADLTILPSYTEAMPRAMMEAMACGSAFLGTQISGIEDHIHDFDNGFILAPHQPQDLARYIADASADRATLARIAQRGCDYVRDTLSWDVLMRRVKTEVYSQLAASI